MTDAEARTAALRFLVACVRSARNCEAAADILLRRMAERRRGSGGGLVGLSVAIGDAAQLGKLRRDAATFWRAAYGFAEVRFAA